MIYSQYMSSLKTKIIISGSLAIDQIMIFDELFKDLIDPDNLDVLSMTCWIRKIRRTYGGTAGNIAYSLALLKESPVLLASIGKEERGYMEQLESMGVDTSEVHYSDQSTAMFNVLTDGNDCQVAGFYPGACEDSSTLNFKRFKDRPFIFLISPHDPIQMVKQAAECKQYGLRLCFDIGQQALVLTKQELLDSIAAAEVLMANDYEMRVIAKKTGLSRKEIAKMVDVCVVTLGADGCLVYTKKNKWESVKVTALEVDNIVEPTGAGDAFRAGFLYGYVRNWDPVECAQLGSTIASFAIEHHGTQEHTFTWADVKKRYKKHYQEKLKR